MSKNEPDHCRPDQSLPERSLHERPFPVSKELLDTANSFSWFFMDAFWMLGWSRAGYALILPTVVTGLLLLYIEKRRPVIFINLAICCWIGMNTLWMLAELMDRSQFLLGARVFFVAGLASIAVSMVLSRSIKETFSHFRRFRVLKWR